MKRRIYSILFGINGDAGHGGLGRRERTLLKRPITKLKFVLRQPNGDRIIKTQNDRYFTLTLESYKETIYENQA